MSWFYSEKVKDHFFNPRNICKTNKQLKEFEAQADGIGTIGNAFCGDMMKMMIKVKDNTITECKWLTMGCASAIATTSILSEMVIGMNLDDAMKIKPQDIVKELDGMPKRKIHCSVLGDKALRAAINDYYRNTKQYEKIQVQGEIIDNVLKITRQEILQAITNGAKTIEDIQTMTKAGVYDKECIPKIQAILDSIKKIQN